MSGGRTRKTRGRFTVRRRADQPNGQYFIHWTEGGRQRRRGSGLHDARLAAALEDRLNLEDAERRVFGRAAIEERVSFAYAAMRYVDAADSDEARRARARHIAAPIRFLGDFPIRVIGETTVADAARQAYPLASSATRRRQFWTPVVAVLNYAAGGDRRWCEAPRMKKPRETPGRIEWITPADAQGLLRIATPREAAPVALALGAGLRAAEIARLDWSDLDLAGGELWLWKTKNRRARKCELPAPSLAALSALPHRSGRVCLTPKGAPYVVSETSGGLFNVGLASLCRRACVRVVTMHVLRHTWATWFAAATHDLIRLKALGGWSSLKMIERYAHLAPRSLKSDLIAHGWRFDLSSDDHPAAMVQNRK